MIDAVRQRAKDYRGVIHQVTRSLSWYRMITACNKTTMWQDRVLNPRPIDMTYPGYSDVTCMACIANLEKT